MKKILVFIAVLTLLVLVACWYPANKKSTPIENNNQPQPSLYQQ